MIAEIIVAAGCFWGVQAAFDSVPGVIETTVGYIGGATEHPTYEEVCSDVTGHAEAVQIVYDTDKISLEEILNIFFMIHNPTTVNRQGPDIGSQYRSAVFYNTDKEKDIIHRKIKEYQPLFTQPVVTQVLPRTDFYPAEEYHQRYFDKQGKASCTHIEKSKNDFLRQKLSTAQYHILRERGTEAPFSGKYLYFDEDGTYRCAACGQKLFESDSKFQTTCGWPGFDKAIPGSVIIRKDFSHFMIRDEVLCSRCKSHLGHLFNDGPTETGLRYCINSVALNFDKPTKQEK